MAIYIGTCGFAYDDWEGFFYPPNLALRDRLGYYADRLPAVELDSLFYRLPGPELIERMARRTRKDFRFAVKLHRSITHEPDPARAEFGLFRETIGPLVEAGKLGAVLAQFPPTFRCQRPAVQTLRTIREELAGLPLTMEFRHASWNRPETFEFLKKHDIAWCAVDEPDLKGLLPPVTPRTAGFGYVRLHGRDSAKWVRGRTAAERHNYLYSSDELAEWADRIRKMREEGGDVYVMFSNVYEGKAIANARELAARLGVVLQPRRRRAAKEAQPELDLVA